MNTTTTAHAPPATARAPALGDSHLQVAVDGRHLAASCGAAGAGASAGLSDDLRFAPRHAMAALAAQFRNAAVRRHTLHPQELGLKQLGHFVVFRRQAGPAAWLRLLAPSKRPRQRCARKPDRPRALHCAR